MAFDLSSITRGKRLRAPKIVVYGPPKIGKSTFAASFPDAIGIITEEGLDNIDVPAFPVAKSWDDVLSAIHTLQTGEHKFKTCFIDSLDWLEPLILGKVCKDNGVTNIEQIGYGKGYIIADDLWRCFFSKLDELRDKKKMTIVCIAHEQVNKVRNPALPEDYDAYSLKLNKRATAIITEWADIIGFAAHEVMVRSIDAGMKKENKAVGTGLRKLHVTPHPAYVSGNRYSMNDTPLSYGAFIQELGRAMEQPTQLH